jgi:hypothetical protein
MSVLELGPTTFESVEDFIKLCGYITTLDEKKIHEIWTERKLAEHFSRIHKDRTELNFYRGMIMRNQRILSEHFGFKFINMYLADSFFMAVRAYYQDEKSSEIFGVSKKIKTNNDGETEIDIYKKLTVSERKLLITWINKNYNQYKTISDDS